MTSQWFDPQAHARRLLSTVKRAALTFSLGMICPALICFDLSLGCLSLNQELVAITLGTPVLLLVALPLYLFEQVAQHDW